MSLIPESCLAELPVTNSTDFVDSLDDGSLSVLSVGRGDLVISFENDDPVEVERAKSVISDMLKRGYMLFVEVKGKLQRVKRFNPKTESYVVSWPVEGVQQYKVAAGAKAKKAKTKEIPMKKAKAVGVAPTAGG